MNVYGSEITEATVKRQPGYEKDTPVTKFDMAKLAMKMINDESKRDRARAYLKELEEKYGSLNGVATKGLIYNATGETMKYFLHHDYSGHFGESMPPMQIHNGQWGVFFHQKPSIIPAASEGAIVYNLEVQAVDCMMSWCSRYVGQNKCYAEIREPAHFHDDTVWGVVENKMFLVDNNIWTEIIREEEENPLLISTTIGDTSVSEYTVVVKLLKKVASIN